MRDVLPLRVLADRVVNPIQSALARTLSPSPPVVKAAPPAACTSLWPGGLGPHAATLEPRTNATFEHRLDRNEIDRFAGGFVGVVTLASVGEIRSEVDRFHDDLVDQVGTT
jgi:hypothetical protein